MSAAGFCVWVAGEPDKVVLSIARAVAIDLAHQRPVEEAGPGPDWLADADSEVRWKMLAHLARALCTHGVVVVLATETPDPAWRAELRSVVPNLVEVRVGDPAATPGTTVGRGPVLDVAALDVAAPEVAAPEVTVPGDGARAGESARLVLRHLAAAGLSDALDDYSDDDEAAISGRLQNFGYL